jgi:phage terminase small subunit
MPLTARQRSFIANYIKDPNATQAAVAAGYSVKTAQVIGSENLRKPLVREAIEKALAKNGLSIDRVAEELRRIAFADPRKVMKWGPGGVELLASDDLSPEDAALVCEASQTTTKEGGSIRLKLHDKVKALEISARHLQMFPKETTTPSGPVTFNVIVYGRTSS